MHLLRGSTYILKPQLTALKHDLSSNYQNNFLLLAAGILLTVATGPTPRAIFLFLIVAQALFGFGVGGEFPVAAASAAERAESKLSLRALRGQTVVLVFAMQVRPLRGKKRSSVPVYS